jgi:hypothetical protein
VYSSLIGGDGGEDGDAIALDSFNNAYVAGQSDSNDFPTVHQVPGACRGTCGNGLNYSAFLTKINAAGSALVYSNLLGGSNADNEILGLAVDRFGNAVVTGYTGSIDFPQVNPIPGACRGSCGHSGHPTGFVSEFNAASTALIFSSYLGGSNYDTGMGIAVDRSGHAYITGFTWSTDFPQVNQIPGACEGTCGAPNAFVTKITPSRCVINCGLGN